MIQNMERINELKRPNRFPDLYRPFSSSTSPSTSLVPVKPKSIRKILAFDLEWSLNKDEYGEYPILAASFCDSQSYNQAFLLEDFMGGRNNRKVAEKSLLFKIVSIINKYDWSIGFYSTGVRAYNPTKGKVMGRDSDLIQLYRRLVRYNLKSPIYISDRTNLPYLVGENKNHVHLDAYKLFSNQVIKTSVYNGAYTSNDLDTISRVILGNDKGGKHEGLSGPTFESIMDLEQKRDYVLQDAKLLMDCVSNNNYELLKVMNSLSLLTGIPFKTICNSKGVTKIWTTIIDDLVKKELLNIDGVSGSDNEVLRYEALSNYYFGQQPRQKYIDEAVEILNNRQHDGPRYTGGWVFEHPNSGEYRNVHVFDITSLYPTMIVNNNISFETVDCSCCTNNPLAKIPDQIFDGTDGINQHTCIKYSEILTRQIETYMSKRIEYKTRSKEVENSEQAREYEIISNAYKILINSAYGQLGHMYSKYENIEAAELVTRYGRYIIKQCVKIAEDMFGWNIIYGDTDSIFVNSAITEVDKQLFIDVCNLQLNVNMDLDKVYDKLLISGKKNYVGVSSKKVVIKGLAGKKSDRCSWVKNAFKQMLNDYTNDINPCIKLRDEIRKLETGELENPEQQLMIVKNLNKDVDEYKVNVVQKLIGAEKNLEDGDAIRYYLADSTKENNFKKYSENVTQVSMKEYKKQLINAVKPVLRLLGYDIQKEIDIIALHDSTMTQQQSSVISPRLQIRSMSLKKKVKNMRTRTGIEKCQLIQI
ncbi:MAG: DNA polymerase domain-containing protein [Nitrososphaeraceae archaeon]